jgi:hypothetical protein
MTLTELIQSEPSIAEYVTSGNDGAILQWLNTPSIPAQRPIPINEFTGELYNSGAFVAILQAASTGNSAAQMAVTLIEKAKSLGIERIDLSLAVNQQMVATLISEGIITQAQADSATALANTLISPAENAGLGTVSAIDLANWRAGQ